MALTFTIFITDEGIRATREVQQNPGWYIIPYEFRVSDTNRGVSAQRTYASIDNNPWYSGAFSALTASGTENKIIHNVVIPPILTTATTEKNYGEIYFIYKNHNDEELLYAIGAPSETLTYTPGISQKFYFSFALNNVQVKDTIYIQNTDPQDIEDHNIDPLAHTYKANVSLDNLDSAGQAILDNKANIALDNLTAAGKVNASLWAFQNMDKIYLPQSGTVTLSDNRVHQIDLNGNCTFVLPTITDNNVFHQMLVLFYASQDYAVNLGTTHYFYDTAPTITAGAYTLIFEYHGDSWRVGALPKG